MPIIKKVIDNLIKKNISISVAESCTGGLIANTITKYSGVSKIFSYGIISYSNEAKSKYLSVSKRNLSKFGAVSNEVAEGMINGLYKNEKTKICIFPFFICVWKVITYVSHRERSKNTITNCMQYNVRIRMTN